MKKIFTRVFVLSIATVCFSSAAHAQTWSAPSQTPPNGNAYTPINVSNTSQTKTGVLYIYGLRSYVDGIFDGKVGVGMTSPSYKLDVNGNVGATAYFYTSDKKLKTSIEPLENSLAKVLSLQGVSFAWKKDGSKSVGFIAQDVEKVYPELVHESSDGIKSLEYGNLVAPLVEAIKEQQIEINSLKAEIEALKAR